MAMSTAKRKFAVTVTTVPDKVPSLQMYYPHLTETDRVLICRALNEYREKSISVKPDSEPDPGPVAHLGLLPFFSMRRVGDALTWMATTAVINKRVWGGLCSKVEASRWTKKDMPERCTVHLRLNDALVYKHFGQHPEMGVTIPVIPNQDTRGPLRWNIGAKEWMPEKISAPPRISLVQGKRSRVIGRSDWAIHMPTRYETVITHWLMDHCR